MLKRRLMFIFPPFCIVITGCENQGNFQEKYRPVCSALAIALANEIETDLKGRVEWVEKTNNSTHFRVLSGAYGIKVNKTDDNFLCSRVRAQTTEYNLGFIEVSARQNNKCDEQSICISHDDKKYKAIFLLLHDQAYKEPLIWTSKEIVEPE